MSGGWLPRRVAAGRAGEVARGRARASGASFARFDFFAFPSVRSGRATDGRTHDARRDMTYRVSHAEQQAALTNKSSHANISRHSSLVYQGRPVSNDRSAPAWVDKDKRIASRLKTDPALAVKIDMRRVNVDVMKPWIARRVTELLGIEDDVVVLYVFTFLEDAAKGGGAIDPRAMQVHLTGFLEHNAAVFMKELWTLLADAQASANGVPSAFVEEKRRELEAKAAAAAAREARRREAEVRPCSHWFPYDPVAAVNADP
mgnify:CR=1 FL=1